MKKTAIITGGTGSIGTALVEEFSRDCDVVFTYINNKEKAAELEKIYSARGFLCDVSKRADVEAVYNKAGKCDLLINNAGISQIMLFTDISDCDWEKMLGVNLSGVFYFSQTVLPYMINQKKGSIINISSIWGVSGASCEVHYSAVKAGVIGLTKALAKETGLSGVRVNCIAPGVIEGNMNAGFDEKEREALKEMCALNRTGSPKDIAKAARYLDGAEFVTGQILSVDGGI